MYCRKLHYTTLHYTTLLSRVLTMVFFYTTTKINEKYALHYTTLHYTTQPCTYHGLLQYDYEDQSEICTTLHYTTLHYSAVYVPWSSSIRLRRSMRNCFSLSRFQFASLAALLRDKGRGD